MKVLSILLKALLVLAALTFALKNTDGVTVRYYLGVQWQAPLILVMLAAFGAGVAAGVAASLAQIAKLRRELAASRRKAAVLQGPAVSAAPAQIADAL
jgi:uncharacterized integral membrane protein